MKYSSFSRNLQEPFHVLTSQVEPCDRDEVWHCKREKVPLLLRSHTDGSDGGWWPRRPPGGHNIESECRPCSWRLLILIACARGGAEHPAGAQHAAGWKNEMVCRYLFIYFLKPAYLTFLTVRTCTNALLSFVSNGRLCLSPSGKDRVVQRLREECIRNV